MMTMKRLVTAALATALLAVPFGAAQSGGPDAPEAREEADKVVLANDHVTVWFQGKKPFLKVFPADGDAENGTEAFSIKFHRVVEFEDANGDGAPQESEVLAFLNLEPANNWDVRIVEEDERIRLNLTLVDAVKIKGPAKGVDVGVPTRDANVTFLFHIYPDETTLTTDSGVNVTVPAGHVKYDFIVDQWPWLDAEKNRLALTALTSANLTDVSLAGTHAAAVQDNGTTVGAVTWTDTAEGVDANGDAVTVNVTADVAEYATEDGENLTRLAFTYDAPNVQTLVHDPTIGLASVNGGNGTNPMPDLGERLRDVPAPGALVAFAAVGLAAAVALRRR